METWLREDGRYFCITVSNDLFGPVVEIRYGGLLRAARMRVVPLNDVSESAGVILKIGKRRTARGYKKA